MLSKAESKGGNYVYLDFWVVSPASDYNLRVSRGDDNGGSFVLELMSPEGDAEGNYTIVSTAGNAAASARIGFLVDDMPVVDDTMRYYHFVKSWRSEKFGNRDSLRQEKVAELVYALCRRKRKQKTRLIENLLFP